MSPEEAYKYALENGPDKKTREIACQDPYYAYLYASDIDKYPRKETRQAACRDPYCAYKYALEVDKGDHEDTYKAVIGTKYEAEYVEFVNEKIRDSMIERMTHAYQCALEDGPDEATRQIACKSPYFAYLYAFYVDKGPKDETREAACQEPYYAYLYAKHIDKGFHIKTYIAVMGSEYEKEYEEFLTDQMKKKK